MQLARKVLFALLAFVFATAAQLAAPAQAQSTKANLITQLNACIYANTQGAVTPQCVNVFMQAVIGSMCGIAQAADCPLPTGTVTSLPVASLTGLGTGALAALQTPPNTGAGFLAGAGAAASNLGAISLSQFGAKCDGVTDDTIAIKAWAANFASKAALVAPSGICVFTSAPIQFGSAANGGDIGASVSGSGLGTIFRYAGASTASDLFVFGYPSTGYSLGTEVVQATLTNFKVASNTTMTAGAGIVLWKFGRGSLVNVYADAQDTGGSGHNLWNGFLCAGCNDITILNGGSQVQNDAMRSFSILPADDGHLGCYCGVVYIVGGKYSGSAVGIHESAKASVTFDSGEIVGNTVNVLLDNADAGVNFCNCVSNSGNQNFTLGAAGFIDSAVVDNIQLNDNALQPGNKLIQLYGNVATAGQYNIRILGWSNASGPAEINIFSSQISGGQLGGIYVGDNLADIVASSGSEINNNTGYGVNCNLIDNALHMSSRMFGNTSGNFSTNCNNNVAIVGSLGTGNGIGSPFIGLLNVTDVSPGIVLWDTAQSANSRIWSMSDQAAQLIFQASNDEFNSSLIALSLGRSGNVTAPNLPSSAGGGGKYVCADSAGNFYLKASCP